MTLESVRKGVLRAEKHLTSPSVTLILSVTLVGAFVYMSFLLRPEYRGDPLPYTMVLVAEFFLIFQGFISFWTILNARHDPRNFEFHQAQDSLFIVDGKAKLRALKSGKPIMNRDSRMFLHQKEISVDVFIPVFGEDIQEVKQTVIAARGMYGRHKTYILDDGKSDEVRDLANELNVYYIRRPDNRNAKAGNINHALNNTDGDFFVIFDADFVASPYFLYETIPFFENDKMAFVQTPQYYDNHNNFISTGAGFMQHVFYSLVQSGKNRFNAAFCVGTNVIFRRSAVRTIRGIYDKSKSEDIWTSLMLHEKGFSSIYIPTVLAIGKTPETLKAYSKQQLRWATGSFEIFLRHNPLFSKKLTVDQRLQYLGTTSYYFTGFATLLLIMLPALQIFFNLTPISLSISAWQWALLYSSFYGGHLILAFYTMGGFKFQTLMLATASFPIYVKAFFNALFKRDQAWQATNGMKYDSPFNYIRMQVYLLIFLTATSIIGFWKASYTGEYSIALFWNLLNTIILGYFFWVALGEGRSYRRSQRVRRREKSKKIIISEGVRA